MTAAHQLLYALVDSHVEEMGYQEVGTSDYYAIVKEIFDEDIQALLEGTYEDYLFY